MADFESIIKNHCSEDGSIPADAIAKLSKAISTAVGNEFVEKKRYKDKLEEIETLKTDKQTAEDTAATAGKWKDKYDTLKKEFEAYKGERTAKETRAAKENAALAYLESKGIKGENLKIALRGMTAEIAAAELTEKGKIKDVSPFDALIAGDFRGLVTTTTERNAPPPVNPPDGVNVKMTKDDIFAQKNGRYVLDTKDRQNAIAENIELFRH